MELSVKLAFQRISIQLSAISVQHLSVAAISIQQKKNKTIA
jgi:hypothetical protein